MSRPDPVTETLRALPKAELHVHLDGSLRPETMVELARDRDVPLPTHDPEALARNVARGDAGSLEAYLTAFEITVALMQDAEALERISFELCEDQALEGVRWTEVRFCPLLNTRRGLAPDEVLDAALLGMRRAERRHGIRGTIVVCALRHMAPTRSMELAELAGAYRDLGVSGLDLAGAESGHPVRPHQDAFRRARDLGLAVTIHAGEAFGPQSIRQALDLGGAVRIGHGTRLGEDRQLLARVRDAGIPLEVCLTSNVQTGAAGSYATHPAREYFHEGVSVVLCTDNRLVSATTLTEEYRHALVDLGFTLEELATIARNGFRHAFAPTEVRASMVGHFDEVASRVLDSAP